MRKLYSMIKHQYDVWHLAKWVTKNLTAKAKAKGCDGLFQWIQSVSNHLWWTVSTCDGDATVLKEKWMSIVHHTANKHTWGGCDKFKKCLHHKLSKEEQLDVPWLEMGSTAHDALKDVVLNKKLLKDISMLTECHHTGELEVYHSLMLKYAPKRQPFFYEGMIARTQLVALDHNYNVGRAQAVITSGNNAGQERFKAVFPKGRKDWVVKPILTEKSYLCISNMLHDLVKLKLHGEKVERIHRPINLPKNIAPYPRPDKSLIIARHKSRFI